MQLRQVTIIFGLMLAIFGESSRVGYAATIGCKTGTVGGPGGNGNCFNGNVRVEETFTNLGYIDKTFIVQGSDLTNTVTVSVTNKTQVNWNNFSFAILPPTNVPTPTFSSISASPSIFQSPVLSANNTQLLWTNGVVPVNGNVEFTFSLSVPSNPNTFFDLTIREAPNVPEPMTTLLGSGLALGLGGLLKREYSRKQKKLKDKAII